MNHPRYQELAAQRLPVPLRGLVECAWRARIPDGGPVHAQRVLPDGCMDLLLMGDEIVVAGPDTAAHLAEQAPGSVVTGLRFRPGHLPALLATPAAALRNSRVPLADLSPRTRRLATVGAGGPGGALAELLAVTARLLRDADEHGARPALPGSAVDLLRRGGTVASVADDLGCTTRTLHRHCLDTFGYGPATVRRVLRFRTATELLHAGVPLAETAAAAGYADQPHLSREVRAMAGVSPGALAGRADG